jgi:hypothetical protein
LELLADELDRAGGSADEYAARRDELRAEVEALKEVRDTVRQAVVRAKPRMLRVAGLFPQPLADETAADLRSLEQWQDHQEPRPALQAMLSMVGAAEQFHRRFTRSTELRGGREIEVLYLGLAAAYFRDGQDGAGVGRPGVDGWQWESRPELADPIRSAFDQLDKKRPPELVRLPLQITREGGGQ